MDKSPKRSPKPKKQKQSVPGVNQDEVVEKVSSSGKVDKNIQNNRKVIKGKPKQLN